MTALKTCAVTYRRSTIISAVTEAASAAEAIENVRIGDCEMIDSWIDEDRGPTAFRAVIDQ